MFIRFEFTTSISLVLVTVAPLVSALTINPPTSVTSGGTINFSWLTAPGDPPICDFTLLNSEENIFDILSQDVNLSLGFISLQCPNVPPSDSYNIVAATNKNIAESAAFSIGEVNSSSTSTAVSATGTNTNTLTLSTNSLPVTSPTPVSGSSSTSIGTGTAVASNNPSSNPSPSSSTSIRRKPITEVIISGIIGGLVLISQV